MLHAPPVLLMRRTDKHRSLLYLLLHAKIHTVLLYPKVSAYDCIRYSMSDRKSARHTAGHTPFDTEKSSILTEEESQS
jgi:hypothetical protein